MKKIFVPIKPVVDPRVRLRLKPDGSDVDVSTVKRIMNPYDAVALEAALRFKEEQGGSYNVVACSIGDVASQAVLRKALAMGADQALWVEAATSSNPLILEPLTIAKLLRAIIQGDGERDKKEKEPIDWVFLGHASISQTGPMLSVLLNWPHVVCAFKNTSPPLPASAVVTVDAASNKPRYPSLSAILNAQHKPISRVSVSSLGVDSTPGYSLQKVALLSSRQARQCQPLASVDALVDLLTQEAGVV